MTKCNCLSVFIVHKANVVMQGQCISLKPRHEKPTFCICENAQLICAFIFAALIVLLLYFLNPKLPPQVIFCGCKARFVSDLVGNPAVFSRRGSLNMTRLLNLRVLVGSPSQLSDELNYSSSGKICKNI